MPVIERVAECCLLGYDNLDMEDFRVPCRNLFTEIFPEHKKYMPNRAHYFSEQRDRFNKALYQANGRNPVWRP